MKAYESVLKCPMCKAQRFERSEGETQSRFRVKYHYGVVEDNICLGETNKDDVDLQKVKVHHLHVSCTACGYGWVEAPAITLSDEEGESLDSTLE